MGLFLDAGGSPTSIGLFHPFPNGIVLAMGEAEFPQWSEHGVPIMGEHGVPIMG